MTVDYKPRLLGISGSIRAGSANTAVLRTLASAIRMRASLSLFPLDEVPPYNADLENELAPVAVKELRRAIDASDGLILCSPEYNYGMSGVLKNALDWASRPAFKSPLKGKPCLVMTASPATTGGVRANYQMRETLVASLARVIAYPQIAIATVNQKIVDGAFIDEATITFATNGVNELLAEIALIGGSPRGAMV